VRPQPPQFCGSAAVVTHEPAQLLVAAGQAARHWPAAQTSVLAQACPQVPQAAGSLVRFTHWPGMPQLTVPSGQVQLPAVQVRPPTQPTPQAPQLSLLD
jgi:hypothetical protein